MASRPPLTENQRKRMIVRQVVSHGPTNADGTACDSFLSRHADRHHHVVQYRMCSAGQKQTMEGEF